MLKSKFKRTLVVVAVLAAAALSVAAPASYAACVAMAVKPATFNCQSQLAHGSSTQMRLDCLAQLHGLDTCVASQPAVSSSPLFHFVVLAPPPVITVPVFVPRLRLTKPPPLRSPVPLTIRYSVFLK